MELLFLILKRGRTISLQGFDYAECRYPVWSYAGGQRVEQFKAGGVQYVYVGVVSLADDAPLANVTVGHLVGLCDAKNMKVAATE